MSDPESVLTYPKVATDTTGNHGFQDFAVLSPPYFIPSGGVIVQLTCLPCPAR